MRWLFFALIAVHGLIHLMGFAKAIGLAELPELTQPISRGAGLLWLAAALALLTTAGLFLLEQPGWWVVGLTATLMSQLVIVLSWTDAKFGTLANAMILVGIVYVLAR